MPLLPIVLALWLGILTSISPCPLATNIAAISFIGKKVGSARHVLLSGLTYTLGRTAAYLGTAVILAIGIGSLSQSSVSMFLQNYANKVLGPALILIGMVMVDLIRLRFSASAGNWKLQQRAEKGGIAWAGVLGVLFAMSFCPVSAGLFFGGLMPLSLEYKSRFLLPAAFGVGTALPVTCFAFIMAFAAQHVGKAFNKLTQIERWARYVTGAVFIAVGVHFCLRSIFELY